MAILISKRHRFEPAARPGPKRSDQRMVAASLMLVAAIWICGILTVRADETVASEFQVKAAFLVSFPKYVDWPEDAFATTNSPVVIGVLGETKVSDEIQRVIAGRTVNGRAITLVRLTSEQIPPRCHILFISAAGWQQSPNILASLKEANILTVGENDDFIEQGGIVKLTRREQKIALEVNLTAASKARVKISSRLLNVAKVVTGRSQ